MRYRRPTARVNSVICRRLGNLLDHLGPALCDDWLTEAVVALWEAAVATVDRQPDDAHRAQCKLRDIMTEVAARTQAASCACGDAVEATGDRPDDTCALCKALVCVECSRIVAAGQGEHEKHPEGITEGMTAEQSAAWREGAAMLICKLCREPPRVVEIAVHAQAATQTEEGA